MSANRENPMDPQRRLLLAAATVLSARLAWGAEARRLRRIGYFGVTPAAAKRTQAALAQLRAGLREHGLVEGRDYALEYVSEARIEHVPARMQALVDRGVDLIVVETTPVALAAAKATRDIPIVFGLVSDPVGSGLVESLAHPGGNVTGVTNVLPALSGKLLELAREIAPGIKRVAVMWNPANPGKVLELHELQAAAQQAGIELSLLPVRSATEIDAALGGLGSANVQFLVTLSETLTHRHRERIAELALAARMPSVFNHTPQVEAGGLVSYAPDYTDLLRREGTLASKILAGERPATLPVEQPTKFVLTVNRKTAAALGIAIPQSVLLRADRVIE
jgi:putative ABC transport system substrate-binding protein